jgi:hypothetical protein
MEAPAICFYHGVSDELHERVIDNLELGPEANHPALFV